MAKKKVEKKEIVEEVEVEEVKEEAKGVLEKIKEPKEEKSKKPERKEKNGNNLVRILIMALVGVILIVIPDKFSELLGIIIGALLLIAGLISVYKYVEHKEGNGMNLFVGIVYCVLGVTVMLYPHSVLNILSKCLGVFMALIGLLKLKTAIDFRDFNSKWKGTLIVGTIITVIGLLLIFNPFSGIAITKLAGYYLTAVSIFDLIDTYILQRY